MIYCGLILSVIRKFPITEFLLTKRKRYNSTLNLTLMAVIIYTGNKVKSNRGEEKKKRLQLNISLLVSKQYPWEYLAFSWHYRRKHHGILYLCSWIEDRWTSLRMQYCLMVLIHWEKSVIQPQKQVSEVSKKLFYRLNCNNLSFRQLCMLHRQIVVYNLLIINILYNIQ